MKIVLAENEKHFIMEDKDAMVTIEPTSLSNLKIISISGTVNRDTSFKVDEKILPLIEKEESHIILDLSNLDYLSSVGMMCIVKYLVCATNKKKFFKLIKPPRSVYETMVVFGIANRFDVYDNIDAAVSTIQ
jgi:anti-anti-sigma factor